jgi:glycerophosphoryl diester phosphodiesterase
MNQFKSLKYLLFLLFAIIFTACADFDKSQLENLSNGEVLKIGHAGSGFRRWMPFNPLPANSMASIMEAFENGAEGVEIDLQMTKDGIFVLYHDNRLGSMTADTGCISNRNWNEIKDLKYHLEIPFQWFQNEQLVSFDSLLTYFNKLEQFPYLQIDMRTNSVCFTGAGNQEFMKVYLSKLVTLLEANHVPKEKVLLISTGVKQLYYLNQINSPYTFSYEVTARPEQSLEWAVENEVKYLTVKTKFLTKAYSQQIHEKGIKVITFGAKSRSGNKKLLELNPDVVQTDNMEALVELLN